MNIIILGRQHLFEIMLPPKTIDFGKILKDFIASKMQTNFSMHFGGHLKREGAQEGGMTSFDEGGYPPGPVH